MKAHPSSAGFMIAIVACLLLSPSLGWAQQPKPGGTLRVAYEAEISGLDPHVSPGIQAWHVVGNLFNSLLTIDAELNYVPDLAESWDVLEDGKVYVFHLRQGVKFHDGTDFDAEVVRGNYQRIMDPEEKAFDAPYYGMVESVEVLDAHTVKFTLKHPSMTLPGDGGQPCGVFANVPGLLQALEQGRNTVASRPQFPSCRRHVLMERGMSLCMASRSSSTRRG
jgi:ABC-type transport system substrate-binding protein